MIYSLHYDEERQSLQVKCPKYGYEMSTQVKLPQDEKMGGNLDEIISRICFELESNDERLFNESLTSTSSKNNNNNNNNNNSNNKSFDSSTARERFLLKHFLVSSREFRNDLDRFLRLKSQEFFDSVTISEKENNTNTNNNNNNNNNNKNNNNNNKEEIKSFWLNHLNKAKQQQQQQIQTKSKSSSSDLVKNTNNNTNNCYLVYDRDQQNEMLLTEPDTDKSATPFLAKMYAELIHSAFMPRLLQIEHEFTKAYTALCEERDTFIRFLEEQHQANLDEKLRPEHGYSDSYISKLAASNCEQHELEKHKWSTRIRTLKNTQQRTFRKYIVKMFELLNESLSSSDEKMKKLELEIERIRKTDEEIDGAFKSSKIPSPSARAPSAVPLSKVAPKSAPLLKSSSASLASMFKAARQASSTSSTTDQTGSGSTMRQPMSNGSSSKIEESYTIQLGAQLKSTHNLRLIRCDILDDYCSNRFKKDSNENDNNNNNDDDSSFSLVEHIEPHSIQTAMSLYSDKLCAAVLLESTSSLQQDKSNKKMSEHNKQNSNKQEENRNREMDMMGDRFSRICDSNGCDFHFLSRSQQVRMASRCVSLVNKLNNNKDNKTVETETSIRNNEIDDENGEDGGELVKMNVGDFYVTRHSNLSQVHAIFHLATFEDESSLDTNNTTTSNDINKINNGNSNSSSKNGVSLRNSDLSSRHPVILGLRHVLKCCVSNNIAVLTLPLLLTHEMAEEMTINWVMKRAELVLKCVKGFMIEFVQWGAQESRTLQFVVPQGLMDETFNALSNLIKSIFRESHAVDLN